MQKLLLVGALAVLEKLGSLLGGLWSSLKETFSPARLKNPLQALLLLLELTAGVFLVLLGPFVTAGMVSYWPAQATEGPLESAAVGVLVFTATLALMSVAAEISVLLAAVGVRDVRVRLFRSWHKKAADEVPEDYWGLRTVQALAA